MTLKHHLTEVVRLAPLLLPGFAHLHPARLPGNSVDIPPPVDFEAAQRFAGYISRQTDASIAVGERQTGFSEPVRIAGLDGLRTQATGTGKAAGTSLPDYQVKLFDRARYHPVQALTPRADDSGNLPLFDAVGVAFAPQSVQSGAVRGCRSRRINH